VTAAVFLQFGSYLNGIKNKYEARNTKQIQISKFKCSKQVQFLADMLLILLFDIRIFLS